MLASVIATNLSLHSAMKLKFVLVIHCIGVSKVFSWLVLKLTRSANLVLLKTTLIAIFITETEIDCVCNGP